MTRALLLCATTMLAACGGAGGPIGPPSSASGLHAGRFTLTIAGADISSDPARPPCSPFGSPPEGKMLTVLLDLAREGNEWVARAALGTGTLVMRFEETGAPLGRIGASGTITGTAVDAGSPVLPAMPLRVTFGHSTSGPVTVTGNIERVVPLAMGVATGAAFINNERGDGGNCTSLDWILQPDSLGR